MRIKYFILGGIIFCLLSCSKESALATSNDNGEISTSDNLNLPKPESTTESPLRVVGEFTNVQSNGEHQWGYSVEIWKQNDRVYGLFSGSSSPMTVGDPPTGILVDQLLDEKTGKFSFRTKLPWSTYYFDGILTKAVVKGRLLDTRTNKTEKIILKRSKESSSEMMDEYASYEDWKVYADRILKFRGPKL